MYDAIYARQSVDKQDSISVESQLSMCEYETRGGAFKKYADKGYSGKNLYRPDFERLMEDIKAGLINKIIVKDISRISRNYIQFGEWLDDMRRKNVSVISINDGLDTSADLSSPPIRIVLRVVHTDSSINSKISLIMSTLYLYCSQRL